MRERQRRTGRRHLARLRPQTSQRAESGDRRCRRARGLKAILHYRVIGQTPHGSWLEIKPLTGRTHQIRVQPSRGHPLLGDQLYGSTTPFRPDSRRSRKSNRIARVFAHVSPSHEPGIVHRESRFPGTWTVLQLLAPPSAVIALLLLVVTHRSDPRVTLRSAFRSPTDRQINNLV